MKNFKTLFKISLILMLLIITVGSVYAADNTDSTLSDNHDDDFELDEDLGDGSDNEDDPDEDDNPDEDDPDEDDPDEDDNPDEDDPDEDDEEDEDDPDDEDDEDDEDLDDDSDGDYTDFEILEFEILLYLEKYGNCTEENWTESEDFLNEYQIYLSNPSNYTLNESAEGYQTYLKIYDSILSKFSDYNLTENETAYLKFLIIYYLNHYGNVSANYTWNESDDFENFTHWFFCTSWAKGCASSGSLTPKFENLLEYLNNLFYPMSGTFDGLNMAAEEGNVTNSTNTTDVANVDVTEDNSWWENIIILFLVLVIVVLVII